MLRAGCCGGSGVGLRELVEQSPAAKGQLAETPGKQSPASSLPQGPAVQTGPACGPVDLTFPFIFNIYIQWTIFMHI